MRWVKLSEITVGNEFVLVIKLSEQIIVTTMYRKINEAGFVQLLMYDIRHGGLSVHAKNVSEPATFLTLRPDCTVQIVQ